MKMPTCAKDINGIFLKINNALVKFIFKMGECIHYRTLTSLWTYLKSLGVNVDNVKTSLQDIVIKTLLSVTPLLTEMMKNNVSSRYSCYELFGFDVLLDSDLKPWLLEVNISPSLHSTSALDLSVKVCSLIYLLKLEQPNYC